MTIDYLTSTDAAILEAMGNRIKALRLRKNLRRKDVAINSGLSIDTIKRLEGGSGRLVTLIAVLRVLDALDHLDSFIPPVGIDPINLAKLKGKKRQRASRM